MQVTTGFPRPPGQFPNPKAKFLRLTETPQGSAASSVTRPDRPVEDAPSRSVNAVTARQRASQLSRRELTEALKRISEMGAPLPGSGGGSARTWKRDRVLRLLPAPHSAPCRRFLVIRLLEPTVPPDGACRTSRVERCRRPGLAAPALGGHDLVGSRPGPERRVCPPGAGVPRPGNGLG